MSLVPVDTTSELAVTSYLQQARDWLTRAVDETGPEQIAAAKAEIATAAEATKQLGLSKDIQLDAQEMVRRAEYALGKAIRKGQADGTVRERGEGNRDTRDQLPVDNRKLSPYDFASSDELTGNGAGFYHLAEAEAADFDAAVDEAKAEGNLSRANVVRKIKDRIPPQTRDDRAEMVADLAAQGYSSRQMSAQVGVSEDRVRQLARLYSIEINADKLIRKTRRHDSNNIAEQTVTALEGLVMGVELIDYADLDATEAAEWATSLTHSLRVLNRFSKQIKETAQHV